MSETRRRCEIEPGTFPESEFLYVDLLGWVHQVAPRHTTDGDVIGLHTQQTQHQQQQQAPEAEPADDLP
jgi:hypothetical protein